MKVEHRKIKRRVGKQVSASITYNHVNVKFKPANLIAFE